MVAEGAKRITQQSEVLGISGGRFIALHNSPASSANSHKSTPPLSPAPRTPPPVPPRPPYATEDTHSNSSTHNSPAAPPISQSLRLRAASADLNPDQYPLSSPPSSSTSP